MLTLKMGSSLRWNDDQMFLGVNGITFGEPFAARGFKSISVACATAIGFEK